MMSGTRIETVVLSMSGPAHSWARFRMPSDGVWVHLNGIIEDAQGLNLIDHTASVTGRRVMENTYILARPLQLETITLAGAAEYWVDRAGASGPPYTGWSLSFSVNEMVPPWDVKVWDPRHPEDFGAENAPVPEPYGPRIIRPDAKWNF